MMRPGAGLHADEARRQVGKLRFHLATRPLLAQHDRATPFVPYGVDVFLPISMPITAILLLSVWDTACSFCLRCPAQFGSEAGLEHGRTIPFSDISS